MKEPPIKELRTLLSTIRARLHMRRVRLNDERLQAGIYTKEEQQTNRERWNR
jgi:hypothetical protein